MTNNLKDSMDEQKTANSLEEETSFSPAEFLSNHWWKAILTVLAVCALAVGTVRWWMPYIKTPAHPETPEAHLPFTENTEQDELTQVLKRLAALEEDIKKLKLNNQAVVALSPDDTANMKDMVHQLTGALGKITAFERRLASFERHQQKIAAIYGHFEEMKALMEEAKPFAEQLNRFAEKVEDYSQFHQSILELSEFAPYGIPTLQQLQAEFSELLSHSTQTAPATQESSWWQRLFASLKNMIHIQKKADLTPQQAADMMEAYKIAKNLISQNNIVQALVVLQPFEKEMSSQAQAVLEHLRARATGERIFKYFNDLLSSPRFIQLLLIPQGTGS